MSLIRSRPLREAAVVKFLLSSGGISTNKMPSSPLLDALEQKLSAPMASKGFI